MNTYESLYKDLESLGALQDDIVTVHSSMKKIGQTLGGADAVLDVLCDYFGKDGLLVFPTHTWGFIDNNSLTFDPETSKTNLGLLPGKFLERSNTYRSLHPTHSVCAYGKGAKEFVKTVFPQNTYCPKGSCYEKLYKMGGKVLLLGVTLTSCTFFHYIEESLFDTVPPYYDTQINCTVLNKDGKKIQNNVFLSTVDTSEQFDRAMDAVLNESTTRVGKFGQAHSILIDCKKIYPVIKEIIQNNSNAFMP